MCSIISLSGAACCRRRNDFYGHKGTSPRCLSKFGCFKLVSVALIQTRTHDGGSSESWGCLTWPLLSERSILTYCITFLRSRWNTFLSQSLLHLKPHTVCGFKPFHAPLTTRYPSERSGSRSQVFGCIFHGIFLFMPLIYDGPLAARRRLTLT